jgi:hypothetical protein
MKWLVSSKRLAQALLGGSQGGVSVWGGTVAIVATAKIVDAVRFSPA